ncbi:MAG: STAS domain-containing protein [Streptosporangiaceae bacterium]
MLDVDLSMRDTDGQAVVLLCGELSLADAPAVASHLIAAVAAFGPSVIVDLTGLEGIGYGGLAVLLRVRGWTRRNGGDLPLVAPQPPVRRVLEATGLVNVFSVYRSVDEAVSGVRQLQPRVAAPPAPRPVPAGLSPRPGRRRPVYRMSCHRPPRSARPLRRSEVCRSRRSPRDTCGKRR